MRQFLKYVASGEYAGRIAKKRLNPPISPYRWFCLKIPRGTGKAPKSIAHALSDE
jgi:hypothetical protein